MNDGMPSRQYRNQTINDFSQILQDFITVLALAVNVLLLRIVLTSHRKYIGSYRYLIASFAASDLLYTSIHWLVYPIPEMYGNAFLLGGHGIFNTRLGAGIYCAVYSQATAILVAHFIYRSLLIRRPEFLARPAIFFSAMFAATVFMNLSGFFVMYYLFRPDAETLAKIAPLFAGNTSSPIVHHSEAAGDYIQALYWSGDTYSAPRWANLMGASLALGMIIVTYAIIIICAYRISSYLKEHVASSCKTLRLQHQLYRSLLYQAVYPLTTTYFPLSVSIFLPIFDINFTWVSLLCPPLCVSHPLFDALVLIFCMTEYRITFLRTIGLSNCVHDRRKIQSSTRSGVAASY